MVTTDSDGLWTTTVHLRNATARPHVSAASDLAITVPLQAQPRWSSLTLLCLSRGGVGVEPGSVGGGEVVVAVLSAFEAADGGGGGVELLGGVGEGEAEGVS